MTPCYYALLCSAVLHYISLCVPPATVSSAPEAPQVSELAEQLERISGRLEQSEREILGRTRAPLDRRSPTTDLSSRLALQQVQQHYLIM